MKALSFAFVLLCCLAFSQCAKESCKCVPPPAPGKPLTYGEPILYLKNTAYTVRPMSELPAGNFTAFPNNLTIDGATGAITVTQKGQDGESQTGMWYKIIFRASNSSFVDSTMVLISGLSYLDQFYNVPQGDSIIRPVYNGDASALVPSGSFELKGDENFSYSSMNGQINIKECMRRGFFNTTTSTKGWIRARLTYSVNDKSQRAANGIDLVVYYYAKIAEVPSNVSALMQAHQTMTLGLRQLPFIPSTTGEFDSNLPSDLSMSKPRPPCLVIIGH